SDGADEGSQATYEEVSLTLFRGHGSLFAVLPRLGPRPEPRASGSSAGGEWVVVFDLSQPGAQTVDRMKQIFLEFLEELQPEARVRAFDCKLYVRSLADKSVSPAEAPALLNELAKPQHYGLIPRRVVREKADNVLVLTDAQRSGLVRIARYFDLRDAIIAVPDRMPTDIRRQAFHLLVHQRAEFLLRPWEQRREAARQIGELADETGGEVWMFSNPRELTRTYRRVAEQIRSSYTLGYYSEAPPGRHRLRVEAPGRSLTLSARRVVVTQ
ncbi:MAG: hypothetical protein ACRD4U_04025, partial [Candidatus Acidiferrales bacterium]